jgi:hypothetical protein
MLMMDVASIGPETPTLSRRLLTQQWGMALIACSSQEEITFLPIYIFETTSFFVLTRAPDSSAQ